MAFTGMCPYLKSTKRVEVTVCECAKFTFPDRQTRRDVLYGVCGHTDNWKECPFKLALDGHYDRRFSPEGIPEREKIKKHKRDMYINCCEES